MRALRGKAQTERAKLAVRKPVDMASSNSHPLLSEDSAARKSGYALVATE